MTTRKTETQPAEAGATELDEAKLEKVAGGLNFTKIEYSNVRVATGDVNGDDALARKR